MAKLIIDFISSLDGYAAADGWPGWWGKEGREYLTWLGEQPEANYTALMGANTYRLMSGLATEGEPGTEALANLSKVVFSSTLTDPAWADTRIVSGDLATEIAKLKAEDGEPLLLHGGASLARALAGLGLIDEYRLYVHPVALGDGLPLFGERVRLNLIESRTFATGVVASRLVPA